MPTINNQQFIEVTEVGSEERQFEDDLEIPAGSIENARFLAYLLPMVIDPPGRSPSKPPGWTG